MLAGGRESLAMQFLVGPRADPDGVLQMVGTVCYHYLRAQVRDLGRTPLLWSGILNVPCLIDHGTEVVDCPIAGEGCPGTTLNSVHLYIIENG